MFYDYTKIAPRVKRAIRTPLENYHLTFSLGAANSAVSAELLSLGVSLAVPFNIAKSEELPAEFMGAQVIDGDLHDYRYTDPRGVIVGLRAKQGSQKRDSSQGGGFLVSV